jgi:hypothetical protein
MKESFKITQDSERKEYWDEKVGIKETNLTIMTNLRSVFSDFIESCRVKIDMMETKEQLNSGVLKVASLLEIKEKINKKV